MGLVSCRLGWLSFRCHLPLPWQGEEAGEPAYVVDIGHLRQEPGGEVVDGVLGESVMTSVKWAEVVQKSIFAGVEVEDLQAMGMKVEPFLPVDGAMAGGLWAPMRRWVYRWAIAPA